jgi:hypothetical protein
METLMQIRNASLIAAFLFLAPALAAAQSSSDLDAVDYGGGHGGWYSDASSAAADEASGSIQAVKLPGVLIAIGDSDPRMADSGAQVFTLEPEVAGDQPWAVAGAEAGAAAMDRGVDAEDCSCDATSR